MNRSFCVYLCLLFSVFSLTAMESEKRRGVDPNEIREMFAKPNVQKLVKKAKKSSNLKNLTVPQEKWVTWNSDRIFKASSPVDGSKGQLLQKKKKKVDYCPAILLALGLGFTGLQLYSFFEFFVGGIKKIS